MMTVKEVKKSRAKQTFSNLFIILVVALMVLPFWTTFNELLTRIVLNFGLFKPLERLIVPYEVGLVRTIISFFGIETAPGTVAIVKNGVNSGTYIAWNCIGWQSFVILLISFKAGLAGNFTRFSLLQVMVLGLLGTFLINIFRISLALILLFYFGRMPSIIFHDYTTVFLSILWLFFFWWFSYKFVLEEREGKLAKSAIINYNLL